MKLLRILFDFGIIKEVVPLNCSDCNDASSCHCKGLWYHLVVMFEICVVLANTTLLKVELKSDVVIKLEVLGCGLLVINFVFTLLNSH